MTKALSTQALHDTLLSEGVGLCRDNPLAFVRWAYPWGKAGTVLEHYQGPDVWQVDFLTRLGAAVKARAFNGRDPVAPIRMAVASGHGIGKALSTRTEVPTPRGLRRWGSLAVGDEIFAEDGTATPLTGVFPQGQRELYRVIFDDCTEVEADVSHLWKVRGRQERRRSRPGWRVLTTRQLIKLGVRRRNGSTTTRQWEIPRQGPSEFTAHAVPVAPYVLGAWLGDGGRLTSIITTADPEIVAKVRETDRARYEARLMRCHVTMLAPRLRTLGIGDAYSYQKHVPRLYMENSQSVRSDVLRGLLDTDGECSKAGSVLFSSTSRALAEDVVWLARSLGGKARVSPTAKRPFYRDQAGARVECRPCWRVTLTMPRDFRCFYVERKEIRRSDVQDRYLTRWIDRIEPIGAHEALCVTVAHPSQCFLANDFVVTHNSTMAAWLVNWIMTIRPMSRGTVTANTFLQLRDKTWAAVQRWNRLSIAGELFEVNASKMYATEK